MKYCRVANWRRFQHYRNRGPAWIKLYTDLRTDHESDWYTFTDAERGQLVGLWLLASSCENCIPYNSEYVAEEIGATEPVNLARFMGHLQVYDNRRACMAANKQGDGSGQPTGRPPGPGVNARVNARTEGEGEGEGNQNQKGDKDKKGGGILNTVDNTTKGGASGVVSPSNCFTTTPDQEKMLYTIAAERALDLPAAAAAAGLAWPVRAAAASTAQRQVTAIKTILKSTQAAGAAELDQHKARTDHDRRWATVEPHVYDPLYVAREVNALRQVNERAAYGLLQELGRWFADRLTDQAAGDIPRSCPAFTWDTLDSLPQVYAEYGITTANAERGGNG